MDIDDPLVRQSATLNPYVLGLGMVVKRLLWDSQPSAWISRSRLKHIMGSHSGEKAVVLCNGPSLLKNDLDSLEGIYTFGLNKINLLYPRTNFRPSSIVAVNPWVIQQNAAFFNTSETPTFLANYGSRWVPRRKNIIYLHTLVWARRFAKDCSMSVYQGHTVTFVALQLAFHMGFSKVALIGADHSFSSSGPANKTVVSGDQDPDHFDPNYFAGGVKWQLPDLFESEISYTMARDMFEAHDRKVFNATEGGKLEVFPRITLERFLAL